MYSKALKFLVVLALIAIFVPAGAATSAKSSGPQITVQPGPWGGPTSQGSTIAFQVSGGNPQTVDGYSYGATLNCPSGRTLGVGHGFGGFPEEIDSNGDFVFVFGPDQGSTFTYTKITGHFDSATHATGTLDERWALFVTKKKTESCKSGKVTWEATPGGITQADINKYDHFFMHVKNADGSVTTTQVK